MLLIPSLSRAGVSPAYVVDPCDDAYFGIHHGAPDFSKALRCYEANKEWQFLILLHLNGEGTPADVQKAEELMHAWEKAEPDQAGSLEGKALREAIDRGKVHPGEPQARLDYCKDVARDTLALNFCGGIHEEIAEVQGQATIAKVRGQLKPDERAIFDSVVAAFKAFQEADAKRMFQQYSGGTIRNLAGLGQSAFVRERFLALLQETVGQRGLQPADEKAYQAADGELNRVYREAIERYTKNSGADGAQVEAYRKDLKEAQLRWIRYRDLWAKLARSLYTEKSGAFDPALSMKTAVTQSRVRELRHDPVGPGE
jgi:uncharacterized protein YecT (DUF1311 family)